MSGLGHTPPNEFERAKNELIMTPRKDLTLEQLNRLAPLMPRILSEQGMAARFAAERIGALYEKDESVQRIITPWFKSEDPNIRSEAIHILGYSGNNGTFFEPEVLQALTDKADVVRSRAVQAARRLKLNIPRNILDSLLNDPDKEVVEEASRLSEGYSLRAAVIEKELSSLPTMGVEWTNLVGALAAAGGDVSGVVPELLEAKKSGDPFKAWRATSLLYDIMPNDTLKDDRDTLGMNLAARMMRREYYDAEIDDPDFYFNHLKALTLLEEQLKSLPIWNKDLMDTLELGVESKEPEIIEVAANLLKIIPTAYRPMRDKFIIQMNGSILKRLKDPPIDEDRRQIAEYNAISGIELLKLLPMPGTTREFAQNLLPLIADQNRRSRIEELISDIPEEPF